MCECVIYLMKEITPSSDAEHIDLKPLQNYEIYSNYPGL